MQWYTYATGEFERALHLSPPPLCQSDYTQLRYIERYAGEVGCECFAIESPYIDRDYMEDHSAFYSKNLFPYPNHCRRMHFFAAPTEIIKERQRQIIEIGLNQGHEAYIDACRDFSTQYYLGFSIIKPLVGTPVGKTVLKCFPLESQDNSYRRKFSCTKRYVSHFCGCKMIVDGLAFQQQDVGVSACATTALWSALQKTAEDEPIAAMTPVQITQLATRYSLPSGRPMPSEGLDLGQMCHAVQSCGVSPNVFRVKEQDLLARILLRGSINSGFAPVLLMRHARLGGHAITAVGLKSSVGLENSGEYHESEMSALYVHDDRLGPNLRCDLVSRINGDLGLNIKLRDSSQVEEWDLLYVLIPMHPKIRISFGNLVTLSARVRELLELIHDSMGFKLAGIDLGQIRSDIRIVRAFQYLEDVICRNRIGNTASQIESIGQRVAPARYLGVLRITGTFFSGFDLLIDTTSTMNNLHMLGIVLNNPTAGDSNLVATLLAKYLGCPLVD